MILGIYATSRLLIPLILVLKYYPLRILLLKFAYYLDTNLEWKYMLGVITLSVPKNKFANTLIPLNLSIISSQLSGNTIVVSVNFEIYSSDTSKRVETSKTIASIITSVLRYDYIVRTDDASPDGLIILDQWNEATKRWLVIAGDTEQRTFSLFNRMFKYIYAVLLFGRAKKAIASSFNSSGTA